MDAQELYWQVSYALSSALLDADDVRASIAGIVGPEELDTDPRVVLADLRVQAARDAMDTFCRQHDGETFRMFRPSDIQAALTDDIEPLFPES